MRKFSLGVLPYGMANKKFTLSQIKNDPNNLNLGNGDSGQALINRSVDLAGWGRSMVMSADGVMIAGNHALKTAKDRGEEPLIVDSDGSRPIIIRRTDLSSDDEKAALLGLMDNRASQHNMRLDLARVGETIAELGMAAEEFAYTDDDFKIVDLAQTVGGGQGHEGQDDECEPDTTTAGSAAVAGVVKKYQVIVICDSQAEQEKVFNQMNDLGYECRVVSLDI